MKKLQKVCTKQKEITECNTDNIYVTVSKVELVSEFSNIKKGLKQFDVLSSEDSFTETMKAFEKEAKKKFDMIEQLWQKSDSSFEKVVSFYGENSKTMQPNEFFKIFYTFSTSWKVKKSECS